MIVNSSKFRRFCMRKVSYVAMAMLLVTLFIGCASAPERFSMITPAKEILANNRFAIVPTSVLSEYVPCDEEIDKYLSSNAEIWQPEISSQLTKKFAEKGIKAEIISVKESDFKDKLQALLKRNGREGFMNPNTGNFDESLYRLVMCDLSGQYKAALITPRLILKTAPFTSAGLMRFSAKAEWDGVKRTVETGGSAVGRFLALGGGFQRNVSGHAPVYSLRVEIFNQKEMAFWSNGGFDVKEKVSAGFIGSADFKKREDIIGELFGEKNKDNMKESIEVALEPLFSE
jgi:hypothetical protein